MGDFTDFVIRTKGNWMTFRHPAKTVQEIWESGEIIYDLYGFQSVKRSEISSIHPDPRPYIPGFFGVFDRHPRELGELWNWVGSLSSDAREILKRKYYEEDNKF